MKKKKIKTVNEYLAAVPDPARKTLQQLRKVILHAAPGAVEVISYNMPMFLLHGRLVYYAAYRKHIGFYPFRSAVNAFKKKAKSYISSEATLRFSLDKGIPSSLVKNMVRFRVKENLKKEKQKAGIQ